MIFMRPTPRADSLAAADAACIIAMPPAQLIVSNRGSSDATARTAPATVFGMSCSLRSRKSGAAPATSRTAALPFAVKNSRPSLSPPTRGPTASARRRAAPRSGVSTAQRMGLRSLIAATYAIAKNIASLLPSLPPKGDPLRERLDWSAAIGENRRNSAGRKAHVGRALRRLSGRLLRHRHRPGSDRDAGHREQSEAWHAGGI